MTLFTAMALRTFWKTAVPLSHSAQARSFVSIVQEDVWPPKPPSIKGGNINSTIYKHVHDARQCAKIAWLVEVKRANASGDEICDVNLEKNYETAKKWFRRHQTSPLGQCIPMSV